MTITVHGSIPKFDQNELEQRRLAYRNMYLNTMECREAVRAELPHQFLLNVIDKSNQGYILDEHTPLRLEPLNYRAYMTKPDHMQIAELAEFDTKIKDSYILELQADRERFKELLKAQLIEREEIKEAEKIASAKAKRLAGIEKEINDTFAELVIPD